ncbi:MAG TPA: hypothetical protein VHV08_07355, partial [Pirellulales bacterium]|nr:hypothetical protein [Pirellulales bacterium]
AGEEAPAPDRRPADRALTYADTRRAGLYKMTWRDSVSGPASETFAVNPDPRESDLERWSAEEFKQSWGAMEPEVVSLGAPDDPSFAVTGREMWRTLAMGLLGLLVIETCFARWAGRQR